MSPRLQRLAKDWKTYASLITGAGAGLAAATELVNKLALAFAGVKHLPPEAKWLAAGLLATLSVVALWASRSRRSILLRPKRFIISADDPEHLVGRDKEVKELAKDCEQKALVFLEGESGAGKSALVLGGLLPHYQATRAGSKAPRLLPMRIDASPLSWDNGLHIELARALREVSAEEQVRLGASAPPGAGDPFAWLAALPVDAPCQVLLVLDQIDDYAVAHQSCFVPGHTVVAPEQFEKANADWAAIAKLVRKGAIHLLIVCRADAAWILDALRFTRATTFPLFRIDQQLISPILDQATQADEKGPVVADPEHGWLQLKAQMLRDLAAGGNQILPVQLAVGLDSVRRFDFLTPAEYAKNGGMRGLERRHIEGHLRDAAGAAGLGDDALLRGLVCLVAEDGLKTKRATLQEFAQAIGVTGPGVAALETAVKHLIRCRILRRQSTAEGEYLFLYHDYLVRGVREAQRQANYWVELLRERARELEEAFGWRQRWRALLPLIKQARLLWGRLRGRFRYGEHRRLALWSTLRLLPVAVVLATVIGAVWWVDRANQHQFAERVFAGVSSGREVSRDQALWMIQEATSTSPDRQVSRDEAQEWRQLARARWPARFHAIQFALSTSSRAPKAVDKADLLAHTAVGLDPTGELSRQLVQETILPALAQPNATICVAAGTIALHLRVAEPEAAALARALVKRMEREQDTGGLVALGARSPPWQFPAWEDEQDSDAVSTLREALAGLSGKLEAKDAQPLAAALVKRMEGEKDSDTLWSLGDALAGLSGKLEAQDAQPLAAALVKQMEGEQDGYALSILGEALAALSGKLEGDDAELLAAVLVKRMEGEKDSGALWNLGKALAGLSGTLEAKDVQPFAAALVKRMQTVQDSDALSRLGQALAGLSRKLEAKDVQPGAAALVKRMEAEQDSDSLSRLGEALAGLSGKLEAKDVQPGAAALVKRMETVQDSDALSTLGRTLARQSGKLDVKDVQPGAAALGERMESKRDFFALSRLGQALAALSGKLEAKDVQPGVAALVQRMSDRFSLAFLTRDKALATLSGKLEAQDARPLAVTLVDRMKSERNIDALSALGQALAGLIGKLEAKDAQRLASTLVKRMETEQNSGALSSLGQALAGLTGKLAAKDVQLGATALVERMKNQPNSDLAGLGRALAALSGKLEAKDLQSGATALVRRMETEEDNDTLAGLSETLARLSEKLEAKDVQPLAVALVEGMKSEPENVALLMLGQALAALTGKLQAGDVLASAATLVERMKNEQNSYLLASLGETVAGLSGKLDGKAVQPAAAALEKAMKSGNDINAIAPMAKAWVTLERVAYANIGAQKRLQAYVNLLRLPLVTGGERKALLDADEAEHGAEELFTSEALSEPVVGDARKALLDGLDQITGEKFEGDLWRFVDWATGSDEGKALRLDLAGR